MCYYCKRRRVEVCNCDRVHCRSCLLSAMSHLPTASCSHFYPAAALEPAGVSPLGGGSGFGRLGGGSLLGRWL